MDDNLDELQDSMDNISLLDMDNACPVRNPDLNSPREQYLIQEFEDLKQWIGGKAELRIIEGDCSSYFHTAGRVALNLKRNDQYAANLTDEQRKTIDLYILAHEIGHLGQYTLMRQRYIQATKRSKEGCADYFAGLWLGIRLGQNLPIDPVALAQIAFMLKGGGNGSNKYPYQEQRQLLVSYGKSNSSAHQLMLGVSPSGLRKPLTQDEFKEIWNAIEGHI